MSEGIKGLTTGQEKHVKNIITNEIEKVNSEVKKVNFLMGGVILVLFVGFLALLFSLIALMLQAWQNRSPSYQDLNNKVDSIIYEQQRPSNKIPSNP